MPKSKKKNLPALAVALVLALASSASVRAQQQTLFLRQPALSANQIAFVYGGDIWLADRSGDNPHRLTSHPAEEFNPRFSPDGQWVAFSADYENNVDVYVVSVNGGTPRRLTWHPQPDVVNGWTPDGKRILFTSPREMRNGRSAQLWEISTAGGYPVKVMAAVAAEGRWSSDRSRLAYRPYWAAYAGASGWRLHRGGTTPAIWIIDADGRNVEKVPHPRANETNPLWVGSDVYFLSDRDNVAVNIFGYDTVSKAITQRTHETQWDIKSADAFGDTLIYEAGGRLKMLDARSNTVTEVRVRINPDAPQLRPALKNAADTIQHIEFSPTGKRALLTARGDIFTVPVKDGSTRNLTATSGVRESDALWSPQGDKIAYVSDAGGLHKLIVTDQTGIGEKRSFDLGEPSYYYDLLGWTGDGKRIVYEDNHFHLYFVDLSTGRRALVDTLVRRSQRTISLSPDSRWLAYTHTGANYFDQLFLYDFDSGKSTPVTDPLVAASWPAFSRDGKYLYFAASTNSGPSQFGLDMTTQERPLRNAVYVAVLAADGKSPLLPKAGDEGKDEDTDKNKSAADDKSGKNDKSKPKDAADEPVTVRIDLNGLTERIAALPIAERFYTNLDVADDGSLYFIERRQPGVTVDPPDSERSAVDELKRFDFAKKEVSLVKDQVSSYLLSHDGKHLLIRGAKSALFTADVGEKIEPKALNVGDVKALVDPRQEWQQIFDDAWRMEKEFFYAENLHGIDWQAVHDRYATLLPYVITREDLNVLLVDMIAELQVGHNRAGGGDVHKETPVKVGLLGADVRVENGRYRIAKIYTGEHWNPFLAAPLAAPGIGVSAGDYILAVNATDLAGDANIYALLADQVGKQVTLTVNSRPTTAGSHQTVVEPVDSEAALRQWNWLEENRRYVEQKTNGRVGYMYLPDTADGGYAYFNRMFFPQIDKEAMIIDERRNSGGQAADYVIDVLSRKYLANWKDRNGLVSQTPAGGLYGPKVMLIDQDAGSGGDFLPYAFRYAGLGKLIGKRTWGGLIGISVNPRFIDGGSLSVPFFRFFTPEGQWGIENEGVAPDIDVELEPDAVNRGVDTQLDRAIAEVLQELETYRPVKQTQAPPLPTELGK
jgi:tricorn protease